MKIQASDVRTGDYLWNPNSASESIAVDSVKQIGEYVVVAGEASNDDLLRGRRRERYFTATDAVNVSR